MTHAPAVQFLLRHRLAALLALVVVVRLLVGLAMPGSLMWDGAGPVRGALADDAAAQSLLTTGQFAADATPASPVYSVALAGVYAWFGRSSLSVAFWHTALAVLTAYAVCEVGRRLFQGWGAREATAAGWLAGLLVALFPPLVAQTFILSDGPLTLALLTLGLMLLATLRDRRKVNARTVMLGVMGGLVIGLGALMSPALLPLLTLAVVWFLFRLPLPQTLLRVTPLVLVALLIVSSWPAGRSGAPAGDPLGQPLDLILYGILTVVALAGVAVSLRLWREVSLLWGLPLLAGAQALLLPSADLDPALAQPALFLFAGAALLWLRARTQARRTNQVRHDND